MKEQVTHGQRLLSIEELSDLLRVPVPTIYRWRWIGTGPRGIRVGRYVRFDVADVLDWLEQKKS